MKPAIRLKRLSLLVKSSLWVPRHIWHAGGVSISMSFVGLVVSCGDLMKLKSFMHSWQTLILRLSCKSFCTSSVPVVYCFILILILMCHIGLASLMSSEIKVALKIR